MLHPTRSLLPRVRNQTRGLRAAKFRSLEKWQIVGMFDVFCEPAQRVTFTGTISAALRVGPEALTQNGGVSSSGES